MRVEKEKIDNINDEDMNCDREDNDIQRASRENSRTGV